MLSYYQLHGGPRTFGQALSHDFQLLGRRVQILERGVLEQRNDGSVQMLDLLTEAFPLAHAAGSTFPDRDPDLSASNPPLGTPAFQTGALAAIDGGLLDSEAPDTWNGLSVNFSATFHGSVTCDDLPATQPCDDRQLLSAALDLWGLPTSAPTTDPGNPDLVYLRFQRGIMQFSQSTGVTQAVPIGMWFKQVLLGTDLPDDLLQDVVGSRYFAQYAPSSALGVARPNELPATSLASAFGAANTFYTAGVPGLADQAGTPVLAPAFPTFVTSTSPLASTTPTPVGTPGASSAIVGFVTPGVPNSLTPGVANSLTPGVANSLTPGVANSLTPGVVGTPATGAFGIPQATPSTPIGPDPCAGDEQILFSPKKPYAGTDVLIAVTSATHHDVRTVRLTGPVKTGPASERPGLNGWVWEWTVSPTTDGWYDFTFYTDDARACATSGFNALPAFGATAVPTTVPTTTTAAFATLTPIPTPSVTPTATAIPAPSLATSGAVDPPNGACAGHLLRLSGNNFGATQALLNGNVLFSASGGPVVATILSWTNSMILVSVPSGLAGGTVQIVVTTASGASTPLSYTVGSC